MNDYRYTLEPYKGMNTRYHCPSCQQRNKTFSRYIDTETGEHIHPSVGKCNSESFCGYHYTPKQYFQDNTILNQPLTKSFATNTRARAECWGVNTFKPVSFIPTDIFKASLQNHETNYFVRYLIGLFGVEITNELIRRYFIGTSKHWNGATVFWQIDTQGKVRTGKIMLYSPNTGKRVKEPFPHINWVHSLLKLPEFELGQCLFAEHLLHDKTKPVAIVESEKTAVIASVYLPQFIWLAVGSLANLNIQKFNVLKGRIVTLFPDLNGYEKWSSKAKELSHLTVFTVSDLLERKANDTERKQGLDLADYLIKFDYREFALIEPVQPEQAEPIQGVSKTSIIVRKSSMNTVIESEQKPIELTFNEAENWEQIITELEIFFAGITLPTIPVKLNPCGIIANVPLFIESHFKVLKVSNGKRIALPYLERLQELKQHLTIN